MSVSFCQTLFKLFYGAPKRSRTPNLLIRSQTLYPIELWALFSWCLGPESNRHGCHHPQDFKSCASTSSATQAFHLFQGTRLFLHNGVLQRTRTSAPVIKSQMLYQLSYEATMAVPTGIEPAIPRVTGECDNRYTTEPFGCRRWI